MKYKVGDIVKLSTGEKGIITRMFRDNVNEVFRYSATIGDDDYNEYNLDEKEIVGLWEGCKPKLKLIDILNKIANGELKEGTKVKLLYDDTIYGFYYDVLIREDKEEIFDIYTLEVLGKEVELIDGEKVMNEFAKGKTICEHEWAEYTKYNAKTGETKHYRECVECKLQEEIEDNTTEKIKELNINDYLFLIRCNENGSKDYQMNYNKAIGEICNKLNEVIRYINKENNNE